MIRSTVTTKTPDKTSALDEMRGMIFRIKISTFRSSAHQTIALGQINLQQLRNLWETKNKYNQATETSSTAKYP